MFRVAVAQLLLQRGRPVDICPNLRVCVWLFLFSLLCFISSSLAAYQLKSQHFRPREYYIGQRVRMVLEIQVQPQDLQLSMQQEEGQDRQSMQKAKIDRGKFDNTLNISIQEPLPHNLNYRIYQVDIFSANSPNAYNIEIIYAVFNTEMNKLAGFDVEGFHIQALTIPQPLSSLTKGRNISEGGNRYYDHELPSLESTPLSLPWVDLSIALLIQVLVLLPIMVFQSSRKLRSWIANLRELCRQRRPYRLFLRQLYILQQTEGVGSLEYYRILSSQVRYYLSHRTQHPCSAYTTEELAQLKLGSLLELAELWPKVLAILENIDDYRFRSSNRQAVNASASFSQSSPPSFSASVVLLAEQRNHELTSIIQFAKVMEKQFHKRQQELPHA